MKQGGLFFACFVLAIAFLAFPVSAQDYNRNYQTYIVDSFDPGNNVEWSWHVKASKFVADGYPVMKMFDGMPRTLRVMYPDTDEVERQYLGIQVKFNRMGDNWFDIIPAVEGENGLEPYEIPFKGNIARLDMWVWGADFYYSLEVLVRDIEGRVHSLPVGWLNFKGWQNMGVAIPGYVKQVTKRIGDDSRMKFVCFRVRTSPSERVDNFYFFMDEFKALTDAFVDSYDGYELVDAMFEEGVADDTATEEEGK